MIFLQERIQWFKASRRPRESVRRIFRAINEGKLASADGTFDEETVSILKAVGEWFEINGESIYSTRPWKVFGEGPEVKMGHRDTRSPYNHQNIRFTQSKDGKTIYAIIMGWPPEGEKTVTLTAFADKGVGANVRIDRIGVLGSDDNISYRKTRNGLRIELPESAPNELGGSVSCRLQNSRALIIEGLSD